MGSEIGRDEYRAAEYAEFEKRWLEELEFVRTLFNDPANFSDERRVGYELEACLLDGDREPSPVNFTILDDLASGDFANELARYDLEINGGVFPLDDHAPQALSADMRGKWGQLQTSAAKFGVHAGLFGVLPNLRPEHFDRERYQSVMKRYTLFSKRLFQMRHESFHILFHGLDEVAFDREDVMGEALCTSVQAHLQVPLDRSVDYYHASLIASVVMVGIGANSPLVLGKRAWHESRIPIFEQATDSRDREGREHGDENRVHFAHGYIGSWRELFEQNRDFRVILPDITDDPPQKLHHFNMHNGTIWRWVRPIIAQESDGRWTLRLELRVLPSGPTLIDTEANVWFYIGLIEGLVAGGMDLTALPFGALRDDFYRIAKHGIGAHFHEPKAHKETILAEWIAQEGIELARTGLESLGIEGEETLDIIRGRLSQNGASWQLAHFDRYHDINKLMEDYMTNFDNDLPVHRWSL